jgi:hypothetical protein
MEGEDIRIQILEYLDKHTLGPEEHHCNVDLLSKLHGDLGTIIRAIEDLKEHKYIVDAYNVINNKIVTDKEPSQDWKSPKRFYMPCGKAPQIDSVWLYNTVKGNDFLVRRRNLDVNTTLTRHTLSDFRKTRCRATVGMWMSIALAGLTLGLLIAQLKQ